MALEVKNLPANAEKKETQVQSVLGRSPGKEHGNQSSSLVWIIPWTEESGRLWSIGLQSQTCLKQLSMHMLLSTSYNTMLFIKNNKVIKKEKYR